MSRIVKISVVRDGNLERKVLIPEIWLAAFTSQKIKSGMNPQEAYMDAINYWLSQEDMEIQWRNEHA